MPEQTAAVGDASPRPGFFASCGVELAGPYCHQCGERVLVAADWSIARLLGDAVSQLADLDSKLLRSLRWLITRPGGLAVEYFAGRRNRYLRPLQLFILANLVYFFVQPLAGYTGYNTPLSSQISQQVYSDYLPLAVWASAKTSSLGLASAQFEALFDARSNLLVRSLIFLMVPALALLLSLLFVANPTRLAEHGVVAIHYYAFELLVVFCAFLLFWPPLVISVFSLESLIPYRSWAPWLLELGIEPIKGAYWYLTLRRFYSLARIPAFAVSVMLLIGLLLITFGYRLVLFFATLWSL